MKWIVIIACCSLLPMRAAAQGSCGTALPLALGTTASVTVDGEPNVYCGTGGDATNAIWYTYTATADTAMRAGGGPSDTRVSVYTGACGALQCLVSNDNNGVTASQANWRAVAGTTYIIAFDNYHSSEAFEITLTMANMALIFNYEYDPGLYPMVGMVDMNDDGLDDIVKPEADQILIAFQTAEGTFDTVSYPTTTANHLPSWSFAVADWDGNGHRDLMYGSSDGVTFMNASADGTAYTEWSPSNFIFSQRTNFVDLNNDGHLDAFVCHDIDDNVAFINNGQGALVFDQGGYGGYCGSYGSLFTDINNDGSMDLYVARCGCDPQDLLMINDGNGGFTDIAAAQGFADSHESWSGAWADFDNDGDMDVLIGNNDGGPQKLMRNDGLGNFTSAIAGTGIEGFAGNSRDWMAHDFDNNGYVDVVGDGIYLNNGDWTFRRQAYGLMGAVGDIDNDGFLDAVGYTFLTRNAGNGNNWIRFDLTGTLSNREAIGARVVVTSALGTQIRDIRSGEGFTFMSFIGAHFGLAQDDEVEQVQIRWPSGLVETIEGPAINTTHAIVEGVLTAVSMEAENANGGLYPNPATDVVVVPFGGANATARVFDTTGKVVLSQPLVGNRLDVSGLAAGNYQLQVIGSEEVRRFHLAKR
ncbi:MAG: FG-GAP-like repeat-containing protein [Flavobacteriales bacterium]